GFALAASVALVTVVGLNYFDQHGAGNINTTVAENSEQLPGKLTGQNPKLDGLQQTTVNDQAVAVAGSSSEATSAFSRQIDGASLPVVDYVSNVGSYWVSPESSERVRDEQRLNMMLSRHLDNSPTSGREGLLPYSRLVGYDEMVKNRQAPAGR
ncbi:MAG: hypothetical protein KTR32_08550, partial [Granulosicoccus sp.]|nr:hypothetical protein [Granulosicoccus sp.]